MWASQNDTNARSVFALSVPHNLRSPGILNTMTSTISALDLGKQGRSKNHGRPEVWAGLFGSSPPPPPPRVLIFVSTLVHGLRLDSVEQTGSPQPLRHSTLTDVLGSDSLGPFLSPRTRPSSPAVNVAAVVPMTAVPTRTSLERTPHLQNVCADGYGGCCVGLSDRAVGYGCQMWAQPLRAMASACCDCYPPEAQGSIDQPISVRGLLVLLAGAVCAWLEDPGGSPAQTSH